MYIGLQGVSKVTRQTYGVVVSPHENKEKCCHIGPRADMGPNILCPRKLPIGIFTRLNVFFSETVGSITLKFSV